MKGLRYSPLHVTEFCGEMEGKFKVGLARLIKTGATILSVCTKNRELNAYLANWI